MTPAAQRDRKYVWHPFTQMRDWLLRDPIVVAKGKGAWLWDDQGRKYLDGNSSIWTNLHGHSHPGINKAIAGQLKKIAHSSALGLANEPASLLAERLVQTATPRSGPVLNKVFFSDDGSTAMEVALKLSYESMRRAGRSRPRFLSLSGAYHGDTVGAVSLGHIDLFHKAFAGLLFESGEVMAPYCYRCPFNRAKPERADAREYRKCRWECVGKVEEKFQAAVRSGEPVTAMVVEPLMQGAAGMIPQPAGWLGKINDIARANRAHLIADEVMTGFGRTGSMFACQQEKVSPDFMALAKGLTGGYLPMAATLTTQAVFDAFLGEYQEFKTFFHGHSYTGNQLGSAAALASLDLLLEPGALEKRQELIDEFREALSSLWDLRAVGDVRQAGLVAGIELVKEWTTREPFSLEARPGMRVCERMAQKGVLTRPIGNVIVLMPPYCCSKREIRLMVRVLHESIEEEFG